MTITPAQLKQLTKQYQEAAVTAQNGVQGDKSIELRKRVDGVLTDLTDGLSPSIQSACRYAIVDGARRSTGLNALMLGHMADQLGSLCGVACPQQQASVRIEEKMHEGLGDIHAPLALNLATGRLVSVSKLDTSDSTTQYWFQGKQLSGQRIHHELSLTTAEAAMLLAHKKATALAAEPCDLAAFQKALQEYQQSIALLSNLQRQEPDSIESMFALTNRVRAVSALLEGKDWEPYTPEWSALQERLTQAGDAALAAHRRFSSSGLPADAAGLQNRLAEYVQISGLMSRLVRDDPDSKKLQVELLNANASFSARLEGGGFEPLSTSPTAIGVRRQKAEATLGAALRKALNGATPEDLLAIQQLINELEMLRALETLLGVL